MWILHLARSHKQTKRANQTTHSHTLATPAGSLCASSSIRLLPLIFDAVQMSEANDSHHLRRHRQRRLQSVTLRAAALQINSDQHCSCMHHSVLQPVLVLCQVSPTESVQQRACWSGLLPCRSVAAAAAPCTATNRSATVIIRYVFGHGCKKARRHVQETAVVGVHRFCLVAHSDWAGRLSFSMNHAPGPARPPGPPPAAG